MFGPLFHSFSPDFKGLAPSAGALKPRKTFVNSPQDATANKNLPAPRKGKKKPEKSEEEYAVDSLMTEIEDDLREEEISKLWKRYGKYVIAVVVLIVAGVTGWQLWRQQHEAQVRALTLQYESASKLIREGKYDEAITAYAVVAKDHGEGLAALAQLQQAALYLEKNDVSGALATYKALESDGRADPLFRDLATIFYVLHGMDTLNPLELEAKLKPLLDPANEFTHSAQELTAVLAGKQGDYARAAKLADELAADAKAPEGVRQRAQELAAVFKEPVAQTAAPAPALPAAPAQPEKK